MGKIRIHLLTGLAWTKSIEVEGTLHSDILSLIDEYYLTNKDLPVTIYTVDELSEEELESYIPLNGGEAYIMGISHIEEIKD